MVLIYYASITQRGPPHRSPRPRQGLARRRHPSIPGLHRHRFKRLLQNHMQLVISGVVNRPLKYVELLSKVKCIVATTDAFLKWKAGQTKA